jgi:drug/metabolite transporter (DMT)-like permease
MRFPTLIGLTAVCMWGTFSLLASLTVRIPPFQLTAMTFTLAFGITLLYWRWREEHILQNLRLPWNLWLLGLTGLFGFHAFYFLAFRHAPAIEALLIINLWPMLIVLLSVPLLGVILRWPHLVGAGLGLTGVTLIVTRNGMPNLSADHWLGYLSALGCAVIWSGYSVLSRRMAAQIPSHAVGAYCMGTALLAWTVHAFTEPTVIPNLTETLAILAMGLGPVGIAFYTWDYGVRHGNVVLLGVCSNCGVLIGTALLTLFGITAYSNQIPLAAGCIVCGAVLASFADRLTKRKVAYA